MYSQKIIDLSRETLERSLGFDLVEHSVGEVDDFLASIRKIDWDPETGSPSRVLTDHESRFISNEILFSRISFPYWLERYCKILTDTKEILPLKPWPSQKILFDTLARLEESGRRKMKIILLKSRQVGGTAGSEALIAHLTFLNPNTQSIIASDHPDNSQKLWQILLRMYQHLPPWMTPRADAKVKATHLHLDRIESDVIVGSGNQKTTLGQGMNVDAAHLTEVSTWEHPEYIDMDLMPAFNSSKKHHSFLLIESTGAGAKGNWFHDQFKAATKGYSEFQPLFIAWYMRPGWRYPDKGMTFNAETLNMAERVKREAGIELDREQLTFYQTERQELEAKGQLSLFFQEYPSTIEEAFQTGFDSAVPIEVRSRLRDSCQLPIRAYEVEAAGRKMRAIDPVTFWTGEDEDRAFGKFLQWELPRADHQYIVAADISYGMQGKDNSAVQVLRVGNIHEEDEQVAEWCGNVSPLDMANVVELIGKTYKDSTSFPAMVAIEVNPGSPGLVTQTELIRRGYPHFYRWTRPVRIGAMPTQEVGWWTTPATRPLITEMGVDYLIKGWLKVNSPFFVNELNTFVNTDVRPGYRKLEHAPNHHDDRVMALFIALYIAHGHDQISLAQERKRVQAELKAGKKTRSFPSAAEMGVSWDEYMQKYEEFLQSAGIL